MSKDKRKKSKDEVKEQPKKVKVEAYVPGQLTNLFGKHAAQDDDLFRPSTVSLNCVC
jgi:hypothetical protein